MFYQKFLALSVAASTMFLPTVSFAENAGNTNNTGNTGTTITTTDTTVNDNSIATKNVAQLSSAAINIFPIQENTSFIDTWGAPRGGGKRKHIGTDVMSKQMNKTYAATSGTIRKAKNEGVHTGEHSTSYYLLLDGDDGRSYFYVHMNNDTPGRPNGCDGLGGMENAFSPKLVEYYKKHGTISGARVERGEHIGYVGSSGNAACGVDHIHFEIWPAHGWEAQKRAINPYPILKHAYDTQGDPKGDMKTGDSSNINIDGNNLVGFDGIDVADGVENDIAENNIIENNIITTDEPSNLSKTDSNNNDDNESANTNTNTDTDTDTDTDTGASKIERIYGKNRIETALKLSQKHYNNTQSVIVADANSHYGALLGSSIAIKENSPVLLIDNNENNINLVLQEIERLGANKIIEIGTKENSLFYNSATNKGFDYKKIVNHNPENLSLDIAKYLQNVYGKLENIVIASKDTKAWPDTLSASALASINNSAIILTDHDRAPENISSINVEKVFIVGGSKRASKNLEDEISEKFMLVERLNGDGRTETSRIVADRMLRERPEGDGLGLFVSSANSFADALTSVPVVAKTGGISVLVDGSPADLDNLKLWADKNSVVYGKTSSRTIIVGGIKAIPPVVENSINYF